MNGDWFSGLQRAGPLASSEILPKTRGGMCLHYYNDHDSEQVWK